MIVNRPFYIQTYRVGSYQLIGSWLFAVPQNGKTGPALYFPSVGPSLTSGLTFLNLKCKCHAAVFKPTAEASYCLGQGAAAPSIPEFISSLEASSAPKSSLFIAAKAK